MPPFEIIDGRAPLVLTCEHASNVIPREYDDLGLDDVTIQDHVGWDIGAAALTRHLARRCGVPAVLSSVSRLVIDCNRDLSDHDLIVPSTHGVYVPGNQAVDTVERGRRINAFYAPYHAAIDRVLDENPQATLLSVHSFTPSLNGQERRFDVGVLFDVFAEDAQRVGQTLAASGLRVRYNEPYSALDGLIFSARSHGMRHGRRYLELELNNSLLRDARGIEVIAASVAAAVARWMEE